MDITRKIDRHFAKLESRRHRSVCFLSKNDSSQPAPDPAIGQAAATNAETAKAQLKIAGDQLEWNKEQYAENAPLYQKIAQQQIDQSDTNTARSADQWNQYKSVFQPIENRVAQEANDYGGEADQQSQAGKAIQDVTGSFDAANANQARALQAAGVNPADPRYAGLTQAAGLERAKAAAGAGTTAATNSRLLGMSMRQNVAQFGRNMPATSIAQDASALNAGNSAQGNITGATMARNAGVNSALPWYGSATDASTASGNLGLGLYGAQSNNWRTGLQANASGMAGLGQLAGTIGGAMIMAKDGAVVKTANFRRGYADGGVVDDSNGGMSDGAQAAPAARGRMMNGKPGMKVIVIELEDPDIDPTDGTPLTAEDMAGCDGLQRKRVPGYADGTSDVERRPIDLRTGKPATEPPPGSHRIDDPYGRNATVPATDYSGRDFGKTGTKDDAMKRVRGYAVGGLVRIGRRYADGGIADDTQLPAPVEDYSTNASPEDRARFGKKKPQVKPSASTYRTHFTDDFDAFSAGGLVRKSYDNGGTVAGPGTTTSDSIPAQLSDREAVLNAEAVGIVGEDFVKRINQAGLERRQQSGGQTYDGQARRVA